MRYGSGLHSLSCNEFDMTVMAIDCETGALRSRMKSCEVAIQRLSPFSKSIRRPQRLQRLFFTKICILVSFRLRRITST